MSLRNNAKATAKVYCLTLGQPDIASQLKKIATDTNGVYRDIPMGEVRSMVGP
jgi:hypothetical protein